MSIQTEELLPNETDLDILVVKFPIYITVNTQTMENISTVRCVHIGKVI